MEDTYRRNAALLVEPDGSGRGRHKFTQRHRIVSDLQWKLCNLPSISGVKFSLRRNTESEPRASCNLPCEGYPSQPCIAAIVGGTTGLGISFPRADLTVPACARSGAACVGRHPATKGRRH